MTLHIFARIEAGPAIDEVAAALVACARQSRAEPGCLEYRPFRGTDGEAVFVKEEYENQAAIDAHMKTPHFLTLKEAVEAATGKGIGEVASIWVTEPLE